MTRLFSYQDIKTTFKALVILDNHFDEHLLDILEAKCEYMILVDGGANRIYQSKFRDSKKIRCMIGDFDGVKE
jgi:thiamine pyrophosphokinase